MEIPMDDNNYQSISNLKLDAMSSACNPSKFLDLNEDGIFGKLLHRPSY